MYKILEAMCVFRQNDRIAAVQDKWCVVLLVTGHADISMTCLKSVATLSAGGDMIVFKSDVLIFFKAWDPIYPCFCTCWPKDYKWWQIIEFREIYYPYWVCCCDVTVLLTQCGIFSIPSCPELKNLAGNPMLPYSYIIHACRSLSCDWYVASSNHSAI